MDENVKALIKLYATHKRDELEVTDAGDLFETALKKKFNEFYKEPWFINNKEIISSYKRSLEEFEKTVLDNRGLIIKCLNFTWKEAVMIEESPPLFRSKMEILYELIILSFNEKWNEAQMKHFSDIFEIFMNYYAYFLSYTNHFSQAINNSFKHIYQSILKKEDMRDEDSDKRNFLAKAFVDWLKVKNLKRGFFDRYAIRLAANIQDEVIQNTKKSIAFIQLISAASFERTSLNWSFKEYESYTTERQNNPFVTQEESNPCGIMFFFILEKNALSSEEFTPNEYLSWRNAIMKMRNFNLYDIKTMEDFSAMVDILLNDIIYHKTKILETVPV